MMIRLYAICILMMTQALEAAPKEAPPPPPPPMPQSGNVAIFRGRSVEIPLRAIGRAPKTLKFLIRSEPTSGTLGPIRSIGLKSAVVTYTHTDSTGAGTDTFTYAVQGVDTPVSAPARLNIQVSEEPPALSVVHALDFDSVMLGETREEEIVIRNSGGGLLSGKMSVPLPWKILGSPDYQLKRHAERKVRLLFDPTEERGYRDNLSFSHDARSVVALTAEATSPLGFQAQGEVSLEASGTNPSRTGTLRIQNLTSAERTIELEAPPGIVVASTLTLPAGGEIDLTIQTGTNFSEVGEEVLELTSGGYHRKIPLRVFARLPRLVFTPADRLDFGKVEPGQPYQLTLEVTNRGGSDARLVGTLPPDVILRPAPETIVLAPDATHVFEVALESQRLGPYHHQISIGVEGRPPSKITVTASVGQPPSTAPKVPTSLLAPMSPATPDPVAPDETPLDPQEAPIATIKSFSIESVADREVEISWKRPEGKVAGYIFEQRFLKAVPGGPPQILWQERRGMKFSEANGAVTARFENLAPGQTWYFRVRAIAPDGKRSPPSPTLRMTSPPLPKGLGMGSFLLVLILLLVGAGGRVWFLKRQSGTSREANRLAHLEKDS